jgi:cell division protease FtsH
MEEDSRKFTDKLKNPQARLFIALSLFVLVLFVWQWFFAKPYGEQFITVSYSRFFEQLDAGNIQSVLIKELSIRGELKKEITITRHEQEGKEKTTVKRFETYLPSFQGEGLIEKLSKEGVTIRVEPPEGKSLFWQLVVSILPWVIIIGAYVFLMRRTYKQIGGGAGGLFSFGQSKAKLYDVKKPSITFLDVAGMDNAKKELQEVVEFLKAPERFEKIGAKIPKGTLLVGPPGTGKTLLARAVAGEAAVPFYSITASEFVEMFVGVGASRVRDMFKNAKSNKPSIIFIDEIDAIGRTRGAGLGGGHDEREQTLNQILSELDGFEPNEEVVVIAATNRPDILDPALSRPGRFDRFIVVDKPGWRDRKAILEVHVRDKKLGEDVDLEKVARGTPGMTGAELENLANEAALIALRRNRDRIEMADFEEARDKVLMGAEREEPIADFEKRITAFHEAGHALVAWKLPYTDPIHKVSIIPRGMSMGATQLIPEEDRHYYPMKYLVNRLAVALAGRAAEKIAFNDVSSGAQSDLKEATSLAEKMVAQWGMSEEVGPVNLGRAEEHPFLGRELAQPKRYSEAMAWLMDKEIQKLLREAETVAEGILEKNRKGLDDLSEALLANESLDRQDIEGIIGRREADVENGKENL